MRPLDPPESSTVECPICEGEGAIHPWNGGDYDPPTECTKCHGEGYIPKHEADYDAECDKADEKQDDR